MLNGISTSDFIDSNITFNKYNLSPIMYEFYK